MHTRFHRLTPCRTAKSEMRQGLTSLFVVSEEPLHMCECVRLLRAHCKLNHP